MLKMLQNFTQKITVSKILLFLLFIVLTQQIIDNKIAISDLQRAPKNIIENKKGIFVSTKFYDFLKNIIKKECKK
jgi:hypothetical protein